MAAYQIITTLDKHGKYTNTISSSKQTNRVVLAVEGLRLLNLIKEINQNTKYITGGEIIIYSDNKKIINSVLLEEMKESQYTQEASATIFAIKREIAISIIEILIEYSNNKSREGQIFHQDPGPVLIKAYDKGSKEI